MQYYKIFILLCTNLRKKHIIQNNYFPHTILFISAISFLFLTPDYKCNAASLKLPHCKTIVVKRGDTLAKICRREYGKYSNKRINLILKNNLQIIDRDLIFVGDQISIPILEKPSSPNSKELVTQGKPRHIDKIIEPNNIAPSKKIVISPDHDSDREYIMYPSPMPGEITQLTWLSDNQALIEGTVTSSAQCRFFIFVPGDTEYEQPEFQMLDEHQFKVLATIGRQGRDYNQEFVLKLSLFNEQGKRIGEIRESIIRRRHQANDTIPLLKTRGEQAYAPRPIGWEGLQTWITLQEIDAMELDNSSFRIPHGVVVPNFRYLSFSSDERYLSWYSRITLYGTSCLAKALLLQGKIDKAESLLRVWAAQVDRNGKVPRSANVVGDNYISPDVRSGEIAHFLGALGLSKKISHTTEWDNHIKKIIKHYIEPLINPEIGLISGGHNGKGSNGYSKPRGYEKISWFSAEHNFDLFQSLNLLVNIDEFDLELKNSCHKIIHSLDHNIKKYFWNSEAKTFNRGWRPQSGADCSQALDCCSWGALYLLKQAQLSSLRHENEKSQQFINEARLCLNYADCHFKSKWYYQTPKGEKGSIAGYRPYAGRIDDLRWEEGSKKGEMIDWDKLDNLVWSEGSLGLAKAWHEYGLQSDDPIAIHKSHEIYLEMKNLQALSDQGGLLYSTRQIKGHFTIGEELASLSWLGYFTPAKQTNSAKLEQTSEILKWAPW
ncbi:LysM peptidoglycan-binding domain-containing protein [bacterium]|nr:LysM peptidoglycan-binding domain-containing protein [bacterium]